MWRYFVGAAAAILLGVAGVFLFRSSASTETALPPAPLTAAAEAGEEEQEFPLQAPSATAKTREQKRFDRVDKDKDASITRQEYLLQRQKTFAKLDTNKDGKLAFDEWAFRAIGKFAGADKDKSGALTRAEFATTAVKRKARPRCACGPTRPKPGTARPAQEAEADAED